MDIKPIETVYNGYRFRSRLEARWAVFFDELGIKYEYEAEGFDLGQHGWYLPDFWLPTFDGGTFCEVKPDGGNFDKAIALGKLSGKDVWFCEGVPSVAVYRVYDPYIKDVSCGIPNWDQAEGEDRMFGMPCCFDSCSGRCGDNKKIELTEQDMDDFLFGGGHVFRAAIAARQARFEHGQVGSPKRWAV